MITDQCKFFNSRLLWSRSFCVSLNLPLSHSWECSFYFTSWLYSAASYSCNLTVPCRRPWLQRAGVIKKCIYFLNETIEQYHKALDKKDRLLTCKCPWYIFSREESYLASVSCSVKAWCALRYLHWKNNNEGKRRNRSSPQLWCWTSSPVLFWYPAECTWEWRTAWWNCSRLEHTTPDPVRYVEATQFADLSFQGSRETMRANQQCARLC